MPEPNNPRENHLKRKFEELPDEVTDHLIRNKRYEGLRSEFMISCYQININLSSISPSSGPLTNNISAQNVNTGPNYGLLHLDYQILLPSLIFS